MRLKFIVLVVCGCMMNGLAFAEPVCVSLEWVELDCSKCPELRKQVFPLEGKLKVTFRDAPEFAELEKKATKHVLISHVEHLEPGSLAKHSTTIDKTTFQLELALQPEKDGSYEADINWKQSVGDGLGKLKPGTRLTPAQMKGVKSKSFSTALKLVPGQTVVLGDFSRNADDGSNLGVLLVGVVESQGERLSSQKQHTAPRR